MITLRAPEKLGGGLIATSRLHEPPERPFVLALWTLYLRRGHSLDVGTLNYLDGG